MSITTIFRATNLLRGGICLLVAVSLGLVGLQFGQWLRPVSASVTAPIAVLAVDPSYLSIGEVWETSAFELTLPIRNVSDQPIDIDGFSVLCDCTKITPDRIRIPAHETREIHISFDLTPKASLRDSSPHPHDRDFITTIRPKVEDLDPSAIEEWSVTGRVRSAVRLDVPGFSFEGTSRLAPPPGAKTAVLTSFVELVHLNATCSSPQFLVTAERLRTGTEGYSIGVGPRKTLPVGPFRESVRIVPCLVGGKELPAMVLPVVGQTLPDIQATPPSIAFGVQSIGAEIREPFTLTSRTGSALEVRSVRTSGEGVSVTKRADPAGGAAYLVRQKVSKSGDQVGAIAFEVRAADGVIEKLVLEATHYGVPPRTKWGR